MPPTNAYAYTPLPTTTTDSEPKPFQPTDGLNHAKTASIKKVLFRVLAAVAVMFVVAQGFRSLRSSVMRGPAFKGCHGGMRNLSSLPSHFTLPSGDKIPTVALGVWKADPGEVGQAVKHALKSGYRHIDGAWIYGNEEEVGKALKESSVQREELFITSKLWNTFHAPEDVEPALDESLARLQTEYIDLYLIHWPVAFKKGTRDLDSSLTENVYPTWKKLEELVDKGKVRNIGVSNFNIARLTNLTANPLKYKPAVNQVELSYWNPQPELLTWAKENDLLLEAYSPLGGDGQVGKSLKVPEVVEVAKELGITPAQVILSWLAQRGTVVLPKSVTPSRIEENLQVSELPQALFEKIETAAVSHPPKRTVRPEFGTGYDVFDERWPFDGSK